MMTNGTIQYETESGGGLDANGDSVAVVGVWSEPIDALIIPNSSGTLTKYEDGKQVVASYTVHLEMQEFNHTTIKIANSRGTNLGKYQVLQPNIRFLDIAGRVSITV